MPAARAESRPTRTPAAGVREPAAAVAVLPGLATNLAARNLLVARRAPNIPDERRSGVTRHGGIRSLRAAVHYPTAPFGAVTIHYNDFRRILDTNPCRA